MIYHFDVSGILETWKFPVRHVFFLTIETVERLLVGRFERNEAIKWFERLEQLEQLEHLELTIF
jgi:hypothetical protein